MYFDRIISFDCSPMLLHRAQRSEDAPSPLNPIERSSPR
jgi:hypothetical protein